MSNALAFPAAMVSALTKVFFGQASLVVATTPTWQVSPPYSPYSEGIIHAVVDGEFPSGYSSC